MKRLAFDFGTVRIGVAASDETGAMAFARQVVTRRGRRRDLAELVRLITVECPAEIVVGLPLRADGSEGDRALQARRFAASLAEVTDLPVRMCDERYSTVEAVAELRELGIAERSSRARVDAEAARHILQRYLDAVASTGVGTGVDTRSDSGT